MPRKTRRNKRRDALTSDAIAFLEGRNSFTQFKDHEELVALWIAHGDETIAEWDIAGKYKSGGPRLNGETRVGESRLGLCRKDSKRLEELGGSPRTCFAILKVRRKSKQDYFCGRAPFMPEYLTTPATKTPLHRGGLRSLQRKATDE